MDVLKFRKTVDYRAGNGGRDTIKKDINFDL